MIDQDMKIMRLTPSFRTVLVAAPSYLRARGEPTSIAALNDHRCIGLIRLTAGGLDDWVLDDGGHKVVYRPPRRVRVTQPTCVRDLAVAGAGVAYVFEPLVRTELQSDLLKVLLPQSAITNEGLFLYYPARASKTPKLRAFLSIARGRFKKLGW